MKQKTKLLSFFILLVSLFSCLDEVEVEIEDHETPILVVNGLVYVPHNFLDTTNEHNNYILRLSYSVDFEEDNGNITDIWDAYVYLKEKNTNRIISDQLSEFHIIEFDSLIFGNEYSLHIELQNGKSYSSTFQKLNEPVTIDSATALPLLHLLSSSSYATEGQNFESEFIQCLSFTDPIERGNHYIIEGPNGFFGGSNTFFSYKKFLKEGDFPNGSQIPFEIGWSNYGYSSWRHTIRLISLNSNGYDYLESMQSLTSLESTLFSTPSFTPFSNITCDQDPNEQVLGFFDFLTYDQMTIPFEGSDTLGF